MIGSARKHVTRGLAIGATLLGTSSVLGLGCDIDRAPVGLKKTPDGAGATVRYDLGHEPLPDIPLPIDTATWPDPTSRTGLRINASLVAPTSIEKAARERFSQLEGWGTFAPISVSFDLPDENSAETAIPAPALDLENVRRRHQGDDYDFSDDAVYVIDLDTGVPVVLDIGARNFDYTLKRLDKYWANDTRVTERNLLFESVDESQQGQTTPSTFTASQDTDFDGVMDIPNLDTPFGCPAPDPVCDNPNEPDETYNSANCLTTRRERDQCIADSLMYWYERETDTLIMRPLLPMREMTRYAVVLTDRLLDRNGEPVRSPFEYIYHAQQEPIAARVQEIINDDRLEAYYGELAGSGLERVAFVWGFTTQPTVDDMKRLRDGLYGEGPFARFEDEFPRELEVQRVVGLSNEAPGWENSDLGEIAGCPDKADNLYVVKQEDLKETLPQLLGEAFGEADGPDLQLLLRTLDHVDHMVFGTYRVPYLLEGGPASTDPNAAFNINYLTGEAEVTTDTVQFWLLVPKETDQFKQPFDVNIYGHGYTGAFIEQVLYAGNMAQHGLATIGINAMGHGLVFDEATTTAAGLVLEGQCYKPLLDALTSGRARDLDGDGDQDSGGDFWSSYLFHTRDGVRQSVLDHIQLVRILRGFGSESTRMTCAGKSPFEACDLDESGGANVSGDFDGDGVADVGGPDAVYSTWGESLGGILSAIHGAIDAYVTASSPGSGGGGLTDIGVRSFQGGVVEAVLLRVWGPLLVAVPSAERDACEAGEALDEGCTQCGEGQMSIRWVYPDVNDTGELEVQCVERSAIERSTLFAYNLDNEELKCVRVGDNARFRVGIPASAGDRIQVDFYDGTDGVEDYDSCRPTIEPGTLPRFTLNEGSVEAPVEGFGLIRQTPALRRFLSLAQAALEPGDPVSFAPFYAIEEMTDPFGQPLGPRAVLTLNTIGDMNVPLNSGIAFARATGALPFFRPDQVAKFPHYVHYATPEDLYAALGDKTPNQDLIDRHVIEGITALARHPAEPECATSANKKPLDATYLDAFGEVNACFPTGCTEETESSGDTRVCFAGTHCDLPSGQCVPNLLGQQKCDEALLDADDLDEGYALYYEQNAPTPHRLARYSRRATPAELNEVWTPRLQGVPFTEEGYEPDSDEPLAALLNAYVVPEGTHTFVNGNPCDAFDTGTYLSNLVARFFMTNGTDLYYLSHPASHRCLAEGADTCDYLDP